jgi:putative transposase
MCKLLGVSRSGYYDWLDRPPSKRSLKHQKILEEIQKTYQKYPMCGVNPIWAEVQETIACSRGTVYRIMSGHGIHSKRKPKWKAATDSKHSLPIAPNLLKQDFDVKTPNTAWVSDITYHWTDEGWLYTAIIKDLCTKEIVGYANSKRMTKELVIKALRMALRRVKPRPGLIFHSDRGSQYCSYAFRELLAKNEIRQSMSRKGNPYDNAPAETFFSCLKCDCTNFPCFKTRKDARQAIFWYIEFYYNRQRRHAALGWISPLQYRNQLANVAA